MADLEARLRELLTAAAPSDPPADGLTEGARRYAARVRRARVAGIAALTAVVVAVVGSLALAVGHDRALVPATPSPSPSTYLEPWQYCQQDFPARNPTPQAQQLSSRFAAVLVCARTDVDSVWAGPLPPDRAVAEPGGIDSLRLEPRGGGSGCPDLPTGPAFRLLALTHDGTVVSYPNEAMRCNGWLLLADYLVAAADLDTDPRTGVGDDGYLGCPPFLTRPSKPAGPTSLPVGTRFTTATICLHPDVPDPLTSPPVPRGIRSNILGDSQLVPLNRDVGHGTSSGPRRTCDASGWVYVVRGLTEQGQVVELANGCPDELLLASGTGAVVRMSEDTTSMLRALVSN